MVPVLDELDNKYAGKLVIERVNTNDNPERAREYGIRYIPTQIFLDPDGNELYRHTGTIHVLVVSGSQVTFLVLVLLLATGRRRRPAQLYQLALVLPATFL